MEVKFQYNGCDLSSHSDESNRENDKKNENMIEFRYMKNEYL